MKNILFVCTGNTCRSPMAAAILQSKQLTELNVRSAGIFATNGDPISRQAQAVLKNNGITYAHQACLLEESDLEWADLVLTMTASHKQLIVSRFPTFANKIFTLKEYVLHQKQDISDPFGRNESVYQATFTELSDLIDKMIGLPKFQNLCKNDERDSTEEECS